MKKVAIAMALISSLALSGCATGFDSATNTQRNSGNGRTANVGEIQVRNAVLVVDSEIPSDSSLVVTLINKSDVADTFKSLDIAMPTNSIAADIALGPNKAVSIGFKSDVNLTFTTTGAALTPGQFVDVTLTFANNETIKLSVLVVKNIGDYAEVTMPVDIAPTSPTPMPSAS